MFISKTFISYVITRMLSPKAMVAPREESLFSRKRSSTTQSNFRAVPPFVSLKVGDSKVLHAWVHDVRESPTVIFNYSWWPGVQEGDCLKVSSNDSEYIESGFLFIVPRIEPCPKPQLQISVPRPIADFFGFRNNGEVTITKVDKSSCCADFVEFTFQDQYLGRNEMWRLGKHLSGQCIYKDQEITFIGGIAAKIATIWIGGQEVSSAYVTTTTKAIFRSSSAKFTIFIQVCRELWEFSGDGERYNEKIVHSFLPALFSKWMNAGTNHTVTIVLISRVFYDESEINYAAGSLQKDERGEWYQDFYKVITELEVIYEWEPTLVSLKNSFWDFQRDILLTHHYHRSSTDSAIGGPEQVRLVGRISDAHDGPILEALNLALNSAESHYIDRSLNLTGATLVLISPGTGYFRVSKSLLRLTTTRMLDQGFFCSLILLTKQPLFQSPMFSFQGAEPVPKPEKDGGNGKFEKERKIDPLLMDPLWGGDGDGSKVKTTFWWEPFWISTTFWDTQMHLPFRQDRFVARAKMHEIQMLGLLEQDILSSIEVPFLPENSDHAESSTSDCLSKNDADKFDLDTFSISPSNNTITPAASTLPSSRKAEKRGSRRRSVIARIDTIEESPKLPVHEQLPSEVPEQSMELSKKIRSVSPSEISIRSVRSEKSVSSRVSSKGLTSKLNPSWLFNPFRSNPSEPQTTNVSASASTSRAVPTSSLVAEKSGLSQKEHLLEKPKKHLSISTSPIPPSANLSVKQIQPVPVTIRKIPNRSSWNRGADDDPLHRGVVAHRSPANTPPSDGFVTGKRRSITTLVYSSHAPSGNVLNPTRPRTSVSHSHTSLASRWQHLFPKPMYKHEINWTPIVTPGCLPLTVEHFPSKAVLDSSYDVFSYELIVDPREMRSWILKPLNARGSMDDLRRQWALVVMRGMAAVRLAQGFQFVLRPQKRQAEEDKLNLGTSSFRRNKSFASEEEFDSRYAGAAEVLVTTTDAVYLSMTNEIHRISYTGEAIQVKRYVRRMTPGATARYKCLIWPKLGGGYTEHTSEFKSSGLENYGWNRLDFLVAGYENNFNESLRYWRTRLLVIPTLEPLHVTETETDRLSDEEARIHGVERLAEMFTKLRWQPPDEKLIHPPVRILNTTLDPAESVLDEELMFQLEQLHAQGPLKKRMKSDRDIGDMALTAIAKAMGEEDGVPIKFHHWHKSQYPDSFIGYDFVSWLVREFRDMSTRAQATEFANRLLEQGLFRHCRGTHSFLDGHYYYHLTADYMVHLTPKYWFLKPPFTKSHSKSLGGRKSKKMIFTQSMVIDIDTNKKSEQAECLLLHHDVVHNPQNVFHFELQWIGTTAKCIEDQLRMLNRQIESYGLKLVEAYVTQISDIRENNPFQSYVPIRLAVAPPVIPELEKRLPVYANPRQYFEYALLRHFNFTVDIEAGDNYPDTMDVVYSYQQAPYTYSQFVHRSGVAFVQVLGGSQGFLFLTNRLMTPGRLGMYKNKLKTPAAAADDLCMELTAFCSDQMKVQAFYDEVVAALPPLPLPPPPASPPAPSNIEELLLTI